MDAYLAKRHVNIELKTYSDVDYMHINFSKVKDFQITMAKELLLRGGLKLEPEDCPPKFRKKKKTAKKKKK